MGAELQGGATEEGEQMMSSAHRFKDELMAARRDALQVPDATAPGETHIDAAARHTAEAKRYREMDEQGVTADDQGNEIDPRFEQLYHEAEATDALNRAAAADANERAA